MLLFTSRMTPDGLAVKSERVFYDDDEQPRRRRARSKRLPVRFYTLTPDHRQLVLALLANERIARGGLIVPRFDLPLVKGMRGSRAALRELVMLGWLSECSEQSGRFMFKPVALAQAIKEGVLDDR
jgi:hypothetical protein